MFDNEKEFKMYDANKNIKMQIYLFMVKYLQVCAFLAFPVRI